MTLERECKAYIDELRPFNKVPAFSTSHITLINISGKYGKEAVRVEIDRQFKELSNAPKTIDK